MKALQAITELFQKHVTSAQDLNVWAEDGALFCGQGPLIDGFELEYTAIVFIQNDKVQPHTLFMHLVNWLNQYDPERTEKGLPAPTFATEVLDGGKCDLKIKIDLSESYTLEENENGDWLQQDIHYQCVSDFEQAATQGGLNELVYFVGHKDDLPCPN